MCKARFFGCDFSCLFCDAQTKSATIVELQDCGSSTLQSMTSVPCDQLLNFIIACCSSIRRHKKVAGYSEV